MADKPVLKPDLCVIGMTATAHELVLGALALKAAVVLVDSGGVRGPAGLVSAILATASRDAPADAGQRWRGLGSRLATARDELAPSHAPERFIAGGVTVLQGRPAFQDERRLAVGDVVVQARRFVLAVPALPARPAVPGLADVPSLDPEDLLDQPAPPRKPLIVGDDAEAIALAQALARLGAGSVLLSPGALLPGEDPELVGALRRALRADGVEVREGQTLVRAGRKEDGLTLVMADGTVEQAIDGSHVLGPSWRAPDIADFGLEAAGIKPSTHGRIALDRHGRSANRRVYGLGAVADRASPHRPADILRHALTGSAAQDAPAIVAVRTSPPAARIGLTESEAATRLGRRPILARWPISDTVSGVLGGRLEGFVKVVADRRHRVLGATLVGEGALEAAPLWTLAVQQSVTLDEVAALSGSGPAAGAGALEASRRAATALLLPRLARPAVRLALRFSRLMG